MNGLSARRLTSRVAKNPGLGYGALRNADECHPDHACSPDFGMHDDGPMATKQSAFSIGSAEIELLVGDITKIAVDAIVNAANSSLSGGGGVDGAIHRAAGPELMRELDFDSCPSWKMPGRQRSRDWCRQIACALCVSRCGPVYRDGGERERELLRSCYMTCLDLAGRTPGPSDQFPVHQHRCLWLSDRRSCRNRPCCRPRLAR